jgi:hypothetical protein
LIDDDLVLTAAHCVDSLEMCRARLFVFDYFMESAGTLETITRRDVYSCRGIVTRVRSGARDPSGTSPSVELDFAVVQLDRPVDDARAPVGVDVDVTRDEPVVLIGFGSGLPAKIDIGGTVVNQGGGTQFQIDSDAFAGNSGSGVFNSSGRLMGVLVRGQKDYVRTATGCFEVNVENAGTTGGGFGMSGDSEDVMHVAGPIAELCNPDREAWPSLRICGRARSCGDGRCSGTETNVTCSIDCEPALCGNGYCELDETEIGCPGDCELAIEAPPSEWSCAPGYYGGLDGCDCECGVPDPDCGSVARVRSPSNSCADDQVCVGTSCVTWGCDPQWYEDGSLCHCCAVGTDPDCMNADTPRDGSSCEPVETETATCAVVEPPTGEPAAPVFIVFATLFAFALRRTRR